MDLHYNFDLIVLMLMLNQKKHEDLNREFYGKNLSNYSLAF